MARAASIFAFALLATVLFAGCGESPLLNHISESDQANQTTTTPQEKAKACTITFKKYNLCLEVTWLGHPKASRTKDNPFRLHFTDANGVAVEPTETVAVELWMPDMGHGSDPVSISRVADATGATTPGLFEIKDVYFIMNGHWQVYFRFMKGNKVLDEAYIDLKL